MSTADVRRLRVGPFGFALRSPFREVLDAVDSLYRDYPSLPETEVADYAVAAVPSSPIRRFLRPKLLVEADHMVSGMSPMPLAHGLLALEMGMNLQLALGMSRYLLLHAGVAERNGQAVVLSGDSGAGKSTLAAWLGHNGWRFMGDEFALLDVASGDLLPFVRPISLKNESIALMEAIAPGERFGPRLEGTVKGVVRHLAPPPASVAAMDARARPRLLLIPRFEPGSTPGARPLPLVEAFSTLTRSSTNYRKIGEPAFDAVWALASGIAAFEIVYPSSEAAAGLIETLWNIA